MRNLKELMKRLEYIEHEIKNNLKIDSKAVERQIKLIREKYQILDEIKRLEIQAGNAIVEDEPEEEFEDDGFLQMVLWYVIFGGKIPKFLTLTNSFYELLIRAHTTKPKTKF